jgi:hypothetical protein
MRALRLLPWLAVCLSIAVGPSIYAQQGAIPLPRTDCAPHGASHLRGQTYPTEIEPEFPVWCYQQPAPEGVTFRSGRNDWIDTWDNDGPAIQRLNDGDFGYRVFDNFIARRDRFQAGYFVNSDHWMIDLVDVSPDRLSGGVLVSPDRQFFFENGKFVVEVDAAAGSDGMGGSNRFYEIDISPAAEPTGQTVDALYGYGAFGYVGAVGCRLERNDRGGNFVCAMYDDSGRATDSRCVNPSRGCRLPDVSGRKWETQGSGTRITAQSVEGGYPEYRIPGTSLRLSDVWRQCGSNEHDLHCRDRFRLELTRESLRIYVNGYQAMRIDGLYARNPETGWDNRVPESWMTSGVRAYFTSWVNGGQHNPMRWHWNEVRINPHEADGSPSPPSASPSWCLGAETPRNTCPHNHGPGEREVPGVAGVAPPVVPVVEEPMMEPMPEAPPEPLAEDAPAE